MHKMIDEACKISIHALREEGDQKVESGGQVTYSISIHALREEGDDSKNP